jgi:hypothetical protein
MDAVEGPEPGRTYQLAGLPTGLRGSTSSQGGYVSLLQQSRVISSADRLVLLRDAVTLHRALAEGVFGA